MAESVAGIAKRVLKGKYMKAKPLIDLRGDSYHISSS